MTFRQVQCRKQSTRNNDEAIQHPEIRIVIIIVSEPISTEPKLQKAAKKQISWVDLVTAINAMSSLIIQIPAIMAIIYEMIKLIFH